VNELPFSQSCENNKQPILDRIRPLLASTSRVLEIAGGTGQHAEFFAANLPHLYWQASDVPGNVASLNQRLAAAQLKNLSPAALPLDVNQASWRDGSWAESTAAPARANNAEDSQSQYDALFSANCLHIMSADSVVNFFLGAGKLFSGAGLVLLYGPFKYKGEFTSASNAAFDARLKERYAGSGIRDFELICDLARGAGFALQEDFDMPANNRLLVFGEH
jgi:cyclopropane fatty-acyl-phospholipid synthase-like methyltransferase